MIRAERAVEAARLRASGLMIMQIAERMRISRSYASGLLTDPDGSKDRARKNGYRRPCPECGAMMSGYAGRGETAPKLCKSCNGRRSAAMRLIWTPERVIAALQAFAEEFGRPPAVSDWNPHMARQHNEEARAALFEERFARGEWPWFTTVFNRFDSWNAALRVAGLEPRPRHHPPRNYARERERAAA